MEFAREAASLSEYSFQNWSDDLSWCKEHKADGNLSVVLCISYSFQTAFKGSPMESVLQSFNKEASEA